MANINKIRLSGQTYNIEDVNASKTVELTQAQYDALVVKDPNTFYVITDAQGADLSNYYTKSETSGATQIQNALNDKVDESTYSVYTATTEDTLINKVSYYDYDQFTGTTSADMVYISDRLNNKVDTSTYNTYTAATDTALASKQTTLTAGTNITIVDNVISAEGGGKAIEAGRGISVTTGETADTVSFNLPISAGTGTNSVVEGYLTKASGHSSHAEGYKASAKGNQAHAEGRDTNANSNYSHAEGENTYAYGTAAHAEGTYTITNNDSEHASGRFNVSSKASSTFGDSGNTLFSVGNGTSNSAKHNAFEIRQNGDIYLTKDGQDVKLQDQLGGGGSSYTAGDGIDITNDVISVTGKVDTTAFSTYTAATDTAIAGKQDTLVSGTNIKTINNESILGSGNIDIQGGGGKAVAAGTNISITTGETADTINCTLPISANNSSIIITNGSNSVSSSNRYSQVFGSGNTVGAYGGYNQPCITVEGINNSCGSLATHVEGGYNTSIYGSYSHVEGAHNKLSISTSPYVEVCSHVEGKYNKVLNYSEHASGQYNNSVSASATFGDGGNTLFSVGNGTADNARHNAFEIRQNGDIYCSDGTNDVKLQDTITATAANTTALGGLKLVKLTQSEYDALSTKDSNTLYVIVN